MQSSCPCARTASCFWQFCERASSGIRFYAVHNWGTRSSSPKFSSLELQQWCQPIYPTPRIFDTIIWQTPAETGNSWETQAKTNTINWETPMQTAIISWKKPAETATIGWKTDKPALGSSPYGSDAPRPYGPLCPIISYQLRTALSLYQSSRWPPDLKS